MSIVSQENWKKPVGSWHFLISHDCVLLHQKLSWLTSELLSIVPFVVGQWRAVVVSQVRTTSHLNVSRTVSPSFRETAILVHLSPSTALRRRHHKKTSQTEIFLDL